MRVGCNTLSHEEIPSTCLPVSVFRADDSSIPIIQTFHRPLQKKDAASQLRLHETTIRIQPVCRIHFISDLKHLVKLRFHFQGDTTTGLLKHIQDAEPSRRTSQPHV